MQVEYEGKSITIQKIVKQIKKYPLINLFIIALFLLLGLLYYITADPTYRSSASIEIKPMHPLGKNPLVPFDTDANLQTDIDILRSSFLLKETLKELKGLVTYFHYDRFQKTKIYNDRPFDVKNFIVYDKRFYEREFEITNIGENRFRLQPKEHLFDKVAKLLHLRKETEAPIFNKVYTFGKVYANDKIAFLITHKKSFQKGSYTFVLHDPQDAVSSVKRSLTIMPASLNSNILLLSYKDHNPKWAKQFLEGLIKNFIDYTIEDQSFTEQKQLEFVLDQLAVIEKKLALSENRLEGFKTSHNITNIHLQMEEVIKKIALLEDTLTQTKTRLKTASWLLKEIKKGNYPVLSTLGINYPAIDEMIQNLQQLEHDKARLLSKFTTRHPDVIAVTDNIVKQKKAITKAAQAIYNELLQRKNDLDHDLKLYQNLLKEFPTKEKELERIKRIYDVNDNIYNYLLKKQSELSLKNLTHTSNKKILDYPQVPSRPISPKLKMVLVLSLFLALVTIFLHALWRLLSDKFIKSIEDVAEISDIPIYGLIPYVKDATLYNRAYVITNPNSPAAEAFRTIRTNLDYVVTEHSSKLILISSSVPNEGKTVVASNLAAIIGMGEKKCILLSLDLRKPQLHHKFKLQNSKGMSDVLSGKAALEDVIWRHQHYKNLHIVTSGRVPPNPAELLASDKMAEVIRNVRKKYDYIIIDTPPVHYVSDAINLFKYADINLFVLKSEFSRKEYLIKLDRLVKKLKLKHSGLILNSVRDKYLDKTYFDKKYIFYEHL